VQPENESAPPTTQLDTLRWQFSLIWRLASEAHLPGLTDEACLWEPAPGSWSVRPDAEGVWRPDWQVPEPDPAPPVSIGWLTWHLVWWWSGALGTVRGETPAPHHAVAWPGSAAAVLARLEELRIGWAAYLSGLSETDLEAPLAYPWHEPRPLRLALAWVNLELMKNIAEIGYARHLYAASGSQ
jgi:hypothetical protein